MKHFLERIDWCIDYYFVCFLYNPSKLDRYDDYMKEKWGDKYNK